MLTIALAGLPPAAAKEGRTSEGEPYLSGGASQEVRDEMLKQRNKYNLWIHTASKSGQYLADTQVTVADSAGRTVLDTVMDGPWLFVKLKLGAYRVTARYGGQAQEKRTTIHKGDLHELVFYFDERSNAGAQELKR
jgi:hypothetical protein